MLVSDMEARMSNMEFTRWHVYYARKAQREELEQKRAEARMRRG